MEYDPIGPSASKDEIERESRKLLGHTFGDVSEDILGMSEDERVRSKHGVANVVEKGFFGIETNSSPEPDFPEAEVELKVTPLKLTGGDELVRPKERLVLCMVDYNNIAEADHWREVPELEKKLTDMLVVWYVHIVGEDRSDYPIVWVDLWEVDEKWSERFQEDFEVVKEKVMSGEVPSERHVDYLGTCPKHGGGYKKDNPEESPRSSKVAPEDHPVLDHAEKRGWSIALGGMMDFVLDSTGLEKSSRGRATGIDIRELYQKAEEKSVGDFGDFGGIVPEPESSQLDEF
jgi:DNA mismatch repair protein MutH